MVELIGSQCLSCKSEAMTAKDKYYEEGYLVEYTAYCKSCGKEAGNLSYGQWDIYEEEE